MRKVLFIALTTLFCSCGQNPVVEQIIEDKGLRSIPVISAVDSVITKVSQIATDVEVALNISPVN
jgi:hypothetical protein